MRLALLLLVPGLIGAETAKLPEPFQSIRDMAGAAPPEFAADALLRVVESGKLADRGARRDLIEQAFRLAASAKFPVRMEGLPGTVTDTASGSLSQAYSLKLDALSLQSRAVRDMLPLDPAKARELFGEITRPTLAPLTCDDAVVYEPSDFYQALSAVVNGTFSQKEKAKEEHLNFLIDYLGQAASASQLAPLAQAVQSASATAAQHQILWARFNGLVESMQPDDRTFSASLPALSNLGMPEIQSSLEKYRLKSHGCETDAISGAVAGNQPQKKSSTPKLDLYWQSTSTQQLLQAGRKLRFASSSQLLTEADRAGVEWQQQLADYLNLIAGWTPDQENSEADYYHEKCNVYTALVELVPAGPQNDKIVAIVADYVDFISNSGLYQKSPAEWFLEPHILLDRFQANAAQHAKILEAFQQSGNPTLALEVALERALGSGLPSWAVSRN
jgi:hypothetical protein